MKVLIEKTDSNRNRKVTVTFNDREIAAFKGMYDSIKSLNCDYNFTTKKYHELFMKYKVTFDDEIKLSICDNTIKEVLGIVKSTFDFTVNNERVVWFDSGIVDGESYYDLKVSFLHLLKTLEYFNYISYYVNECFAEQSVEKLATIFKEWIDFAKVCVFILRPEVKRYLFDETYKITDGDLTYFLFGLNSKIEYTFLRLRPSEIREGYIAMIDEDYDSPIELPLQFYTTYSLGGDFVKYEHIISLKKLKSHLGGKIRIERGEL